MKGIIYKIVCNETGEVYYGSSQTTLHKRILNHKSHYNSWKIGNTNYMTSFQIMERGNYSYSLIETVECETKRQLEARERFYIESNECVNKMIPCRTRQESKKAYRETHKEEMNEWREANKEKIKEQTKLYRQANKEHLNELRRQRRARQRELGLPVY